MVVEVELARAECYRKVALFTRTSRMMLEDVRTGRRMLYVSPILLFSMQSNTPVRAFTSERPRGSVPPNIVEREPNSAFAWTLTHRAAFGNYCSHLRGAIQLVSGTGF